MNNIPLTIMLLFGATTITTIWLFYNAALKSKSVLVCTLGWMILQTIVGIPGFYEEPHSIPPRFVLLIVPGLLFSILLLLTDSGRRFLDTLDIKKLTILHTIRIPVEITLYFVYIAKLVPMLMTFEGRNYDIISGITAPLMYFLVFKSRKLGRVALLVWNILCLGLLLNVLGIAILSAQTPFQILALDQPNIGVTYFPFVWLPSVVVPIVLVAHLAAIRQLSKCGVNSVSLK